MDITDLKGRTIVDIVELKHTYDNNIVCVLLLDNGKIIHEEDGEYGGNNMSIYDSLSECKQIHGLNEVNKDDK